MQTAQLTAACTSRGKRRGNRTSGDLEAKIRELADLPRPDLTERWRQLYRAEPKPSGSKPKGRTSPPAVRPGTKQALLIDLLKRKKGATIEEIVEATGWQAHSVRGAISGALKKKLGLAVTSEKVQARGRVYRIVERS